MAAEPIVLHLPDDSHDMLVSVTQPHSHESHHHQHNDEHDDHNDNTDHDAEAETTAKNALTIALTASDNHDASSHEHAKHIHGHADVPSQQFLFVSVVAAGESYLHHSQLTGITHTPPVPPPNA